MRPNEPISNFDVNDSAAHANSPEVGGSQSSNPAITAGRLQVGDRAVYRTHLAKITGVREQKISGTLVKLYEVTLDRSPQARHSKSPNTVFVAYDNPAGNGLRRPMSLQESDQALAALGNSDTYIDVNQDWTRLRPEIEKKLRIGGSLGLAQALSACSVFVSRQVAHHTAANEMLDSLHKLLISEVAEARALSFKDQKDLSQDILRKLRKKSLASQ